MTPGTSPLTFEDAIRIAAGCADYGGGYRGTPESEIYQHGIQTVLAALKAAASSGLGDAQTAALHRIGAEKVEPAAGQTPETIFAAVRAWAEGYRAGVDDERMSEANVGVAGFGAKVHPARENPYAAAQPSKPIDWERIARVQDCKLRAMCDEPGAFEKLRELLNRCEAEPDAETFKLIRDCRDAFAEELSAWDIDPPVAHVKQGFDDCERWLAKHAPKGGNP